MTTEANARERWETPATTAITDTDGRADQADVTLQNGFSSQPS
jgi:hypothetical protein